MALFTTVDEGYCVQVFRSWGAVASSLALAQSSYALAQFSDSPTSLAAIVKELRKTGCVRLFELDAQDWKYKIDRHDTHGRRVAKPRASHEPPN